MSEAKTYVFGNEGNTSSMLASLLSQRGVDPNILALMNRNNDGFGGNSFIWVIFLFFLMGWGRNGWGNNGGTDTSGLANMINNDTGRDLLMSAIQGNNTAISQLATTLNCSVGNIQQAINAVQGSVSQVGNQVGMSGQQVINAIQQGNMSIAQQLSNCCCDIRESVTRMGYENQLSTCNQTNTLTNNNNNNTQSILNKLSEIQSQNLQDKIEALRERNTQLTTDLVNSQQTTAFSQMLAPINAAIADIQGKLPNTVTLPYSCATAIPSCTAFSLFGGYNGFGNGYNYFG